MIHDSNKSSFIIDTLQQLTGGFVEDVNGYTINNTQDNSNIYLL